MTVTGTRIRGGTTPSPVITIGSERIQEEGFTDLGQVIRSIPQNFRGGQNPGVINGTASSLSNQNLTGGSGLNLRGLGPDATLTLLNGRRMSYGGFAQAVDISAIPVEAVERLEIVPDGASAIYGSDAVGGVGNVILKRDFDGMTVGARYGGATDGGLHTRVYTATAGYQWSTGGFIATYKDASHDPIYADQRGYTENMYDPYTIYSGDALRSGLLSIHQSFGDKVELRLDALRTKRDKISYWGYPGFYASAAPETISSLVSPTIEVSLPNDWTLSIWGSWGKDETNYYGSTVAPTEISSSGTFYGNKSSAYEMDAEGSLFSLPGGDARLAFGAGYRTNDFLQRNLISQNISANGEESSRFAYAEINLPLIGPDENIAGVQRLALTAAVRGEDYDSLGSVTTPKLGVIYGPSADFTLKASWGKSFKAPTLLQQGQAQSAYLYTANNFGGTGYATDATVLMSYGGNPHLNPERAKTWSTSLAFHPEALPNLETELTWFNIDYTDRVVQPIPNLYQALSNQAYAEFVDYYPTSAKLADILATAHMLYNNAGVAYDATKVVAIVNDLYTNASRQRIKGLDLSGSYRFDLGSGRLTVRGLASWLDSKQQLTSAQANYDLAGTLFNPAKVNGRVGAVWNQGNLSASTFVNYVSGVTNTLDGLKSASFTSFDTTLRYDTGERNDALSALVFELSAQNLFNRTPPLYTPTSVTAFRYDSTNYSAVGRYLSVAVSKHW
jgi:outer membrane receptor protein involved in Fe transport